MDPSNSGYYNVKILLQKNLGQDKDKKKIDEEDLEGVESVLKDIADFLLD